VRTAPYDPSRRAEIAELMERVWGKRPTDEELGWFYEQNPVRPASVLLGELDGRVVSTAAISFLRMSIGGEPTEVGMPVRLATDPEVRGRGFFAELEAHNEERARELGIRLLFVVPTAASESVLLGRLGWQRLPPLRAWAQVRYGRGHAPAAGGERLDWAPGDVGAGDRVLRDSDWLNWRFVDSPTPYALLCAPDGYAAAGRRGKVGVVAAVDGPSSLLRAAAAAAGGPILVAAPPPSQRRRYALAGFLPTTRTFTLLGKSLDGSALPARPHFELGDLDFL
jgi:GNAT superfamily N-acetyltransferase